MPPKSLNSFFIDLIYKAFASQSGKRRFALVGANGAGKSRLLRQLAGNMTKVDYYKGDEARRVMPHVLISASRGIQDKAPDPPASREIDLDHVLKQLDQSDSMGYLPGAALLKMISRLRLQAENAERKYDREIVAWYRGGRVGDGPGEPPENLIDTVLSKLSAIFGRPFALEGENLVFGAAKSKVDKLSDGERQILYLSVLLLAQAEDRFVFLVDEPELHLNEARAIEIWERVERQFPNAVFLYATHNLLFATRPEIDAAWLIKADQSFDTLDIKRPLPANTIRDMMGARIQLLVHGRPPLFCEDDLSKLIFEDIFDDGSVEVINVGGSTNVKRAVEAEIGSGWEVIRSGEKCVGIIDRDINTDDEVREKESRTPGLFCLPRYDAEAVVLDPEIATFAIGNLVVGKFDRRNYDTALIEAARSALIPTVKIIASRVAQNAIPKPNLASLPQVQYGLINAAEIEANASLRAKELADAISANDAIAILRLFKGKTLYKGFHPALSRLLGTTVPSDATALYVQTRNHRATFPALLKQISWVQELKTRIGAHLRTV